MARRDARTADDPAIVELVDELWTTHGLDYRGWSAAVIEARARRRAALEGLPDLDALRARLRDDHRCLEQLIDDLATPPPGPFADPGFARALRTEICPRLRTYPSIRVWHAGCASGEDVYTLAIVLREEGLLARTRIYATDIGDHLLERAQEGVSEAAWPGACARYLAAGGTSRLAEYYFLRDEGRLTAREALRERIVFAVHAFASDASFNEFHLVVCRGLLAQFGAGLRARAVQVIDDSLIRFGYLALGDGEAARVAPRRDRFEQVRWADDVLRKIA